MVIMMVFILRTIRGYFSPRPRGRIGGITATAPVTVVVLICFLRQANAALARPVQTEAGEHHTHRAHAPPPPKLAVWSARTRFVGTHDAPVRLVVLATMVEKGFDAAKAGDVVEEGFRSTVYGFRTDPSGWKGAWG